MIATPFEMGSFLTTDQVLWTNFFCRPVKPVAASMAVWSLFELEDIAEPILPALALQRNNKQLSLIINANNIKHILLKVWLPPPPIINFHYSHFFFLFPRFALRSDADWSNKVILILAILATKNTKLKPLCLYALKLVFTFTIPIIQFLVFDKTLFFQLRKLMTSSSYFDSNEAF